jgi:hypothetical protein
MQFRMADVTSPNGISKIPPALNITYREEVTLHGPQSFAGLAKKKEQIDHRKQKLKSHKK